MVNKIRHLKLRSESQPRITRKMVLVIAGGVLLALVIGVTSWQVMQNNDYHKKVAAYSADITSTLDTAKTDFQNLAAEVDPIATSKALAELATSVEKKSQQTPAEPRLLGLAAGTDTDHTKQMKIANAAKKYSTELRASAAYIDYQQSVATTLEGLTLKSASSQAQLDDFGASWLAALTSLQKITPAARAADAHAALVKKITDIVALNARLSELYKKIDTAGFSATKKDLDAAVAELHATGDQFAKAATAYDEAITSALSELKKQL